MHSVSTNFLVAVLFITATTVITTNALEKQEAPLAFTEDVKNPRFQKRSNNKFHQENSNGGGQGVSFGPAGDFEIPGFGKGWGSDGVIGSGYGAGYGSPIRPIVVCKQRGPCYHKKVICPAKCSTSYSYSGKYQGADAGSGRCTADCKLKCIAFC